MTRAPEAAAPFPAQRRARVARALRVAAERTESLPPVRVLAGAVAIEWLAVLGLALTVRHNGWIYYQGGDQLWYWSSGWLLAHGTLPIPLVGFGWPALFAPLAAVNGSSLVSALPAIVLVDVLVLLPVAVFCLYGIAQRIGGRLFGYWAVLVWLAVPFIGIRYTDLGYHQKFTELLLPQAFGLTAMADFPSLVAVVVSVYFCMRILERPTAIDAVAAGLAGGFAIAVKPGSAPFLAGPLLAFLWRRWWPAFPLYAAGTVPAVVALALWKYRGYGYLPILHSEGTLRIAAGAAGALPLASVHQYVHLDWHHLHVNLLGLKEHFWSARVIEWLVAAGFVGLGRRSRGALLLVGGWFAAFVIVKGTYPNAGIEDGSLFRVMMPSYPAFVLLLASIPLLLPHGPRVLRPARAAFKGPSPPTRWKLVGAAAVVFGLYPLALVAAATPIRGTSPPAVKVGGPLSLVDSGMHVRVVVDRKAHVVNLYWPAASALGSHVIYDVFRTNAADGGISCSTPPGAAADCQLTADTVGQTREPVWSGPAQPGRWIYRVGVLANWLNDPHYGDVYYVSPPAVAHIG